jgi:hypothetical protein
MTDAVVTTSTAPADPTSPGPLTQHQAEPTRHDGSPRPGVIPDAQYDALPPADRDRFARVRKGPEGGSEWIERSKLEAEPADPSKATAAPATTAPGDKIKVGQFEVTETEFADLMKFKGETELRKAAVPSDPTGYKVELPADTVMPPGMEWKFNEADPALAVARAWAHKTGLTQPQFAELLGQYAGMEAAKESTYRAAMKRELDALGANATMRVTALQTWLDGVVGPDIAKHMKAGMFSAKIVEGFEKIANKMTSQGAASFRQDGREPAVNGRGPLSSMSEEAYGALSAQERFKISRMGS